MTWLATELRSLSSHLRVKRVNHGGGVVAVAAVAAVVAVVAVVASDADIHTCHVDPSPRRPTTVGHRGVQNSSKCLQVCTHEHRGVIARYMELVERRSRFSSENCAST